MSYFKPKVNVWFLEPPRAELFYLCMEDMDTGREALASNLVMDAIVYRCLEIAVDAVGCLDSELL